ncbi:MAG: hypothetical protein M3N11_05755 [Actinomycetota bacterium]|nr:hypothetical protein [Actinomycetota bacterium]
MHVLDRRALVAGTLTALAVIVPVTVLGAILGGGVEDTNLVFLLLAPVLVGFGAGAYVAARRAVAGPLTNGALAAVAAFGLVQGVGLVRRLGPTSRSRQRASPSPPCWPTPAASSARLSPSGVRRNRRFWALDVGERRPVPRTPQGVAALTTY